MPVTLPLEVYEALERGLGKEDARTIVKSLETTISEATEYKWATTKEELLNAIRREFVTRELFEEKINGIRAEMFGIKADLEGKIENVRTDLEGKIENVRTGLGAEIKRVDMKLNFLIVLMVIALTLMNPVVAEIIKQLLGL